MSKRSILIERDEHATELMLKQEGPPPRYIAVEGPIGVGKTTLSELLSLRYRSQLILERYEENPFLAKFYEDRKRMAFQTQIFFLLSRYRQQQELMQTDLFYTSVVSDYMFEKDRIFAAINLSDDELKLYDQIERALTKTIPTPDVIIYMQSSVAHLESNIQLRGRPMEKKISRDYMEVLVNAYNDFFFHYRDTRLIVVNAETVDFMNKPEHLDQLIQTIERSPHPPVEYMNPLTDELFALQQ